MMSSYSVLVPDFSSGGRKAFPPMLEQSAELLHVIVGDMGGVTSVLR